MALIENFQGINDQIDETYSLEQQAYERIRSAILEKTLKPGEKIHLAEWAERLNMSRTPVRDTLRRLENDGLVIRESERQWHVYVLTLEDVYRIFEARIGVDGEIAYLAARNITDEQLIEVQAILDEAEQTRNQNDYEFYHSVDEKFHQLLNNAANNEYLIQFQLRLIDKLGRIYPKGLNIGNRLQASLSENKLIAQALFEHNPEKARENQIIHINAYRDHLFLVLQKLVIPFTGPTF
jgi:DNA-binding GntR family transcriptional regulator